MDSSKRKKLAHRIFNTKVSYFFMYTLFFICLSFALAAIFHLLNKSVIWRPDGFLQHYPAFVMTKDWIASVIHYLKGNVNQVPFYSFQLGQGADIITTLNSYDLTDPVSWIAILLCSGHVYRAYCLMILIKVYLAGACFSLFALQFTEDRAAVFCGCLTYLFSGMLIILSMLHPNFISGFYFLPLMLYGEELYIRKRRLVPLTAAVFLSVLTNYYVFYMTAILFAGYTLIRVFRIQAVKDSFLTACKIAGLSIVGVMLSGIVLLPTVYAYLHCSRSGVQTGYSASLFFYPADFYKKLIQYAFTPGGSSAGMYTILSLFPISLISIVLLFIRKTEWGRLRLMFLLSLIMACIPACGRFMNAMGYPRNIWTYGMLLLLAFAAAVMFPVLKSLKTGEIVVLIAGALVYTFYTLGDQSIKSEGEILGILLLWITMAAVIFGGKSKSRRLFPVMVLCSTLLMAVCNLAASYHNPDGLSSHISRSEITSFLAKEAVKLGQGSEDEFYRVEKQSLSQNLEHQLGYYGTTYFWSIMPENLHEYYSGLYMNTLAQSCNTKGLDGRLSLSALASVKYFAVRKGGENYVPYGYLNEGGIFRNPASLPVGYLFRGYIPAEQYESLTPIAKQQAILQGAVVEEDMDGLPLIHTDDRHQEIRYTIGDCQDASYDGNTLVVEKKGGFITLYFEGVPDAEMTLYLNGLECVTGANATDIEVRVNQISKSGRVFTKENNWPVFLDGISFNLGSRFENAAYECTIGFSQKGTFSLESIQICAVPCLFYYENIDSLREHVLENVELNSDRVTGSIDSNEPGILQFSIPFNGGWTVYVDGEKRELIPSDLLYMAVQIPAGRHEIELRYVTPFLKEGILLSGLGLLMFVVLFIKRYLFDKR